MDPSHGRDGEKNQNPALHLYAALRELKNQTHFLSINSGTQHSFSMNLLVPRREGNACPNVLQNIWTGIRFATLISGLALVSASYSDDCTRIKRRIPFSNVDADQLYFPERLHPCCRMQSGVGVGEKSSLDCKQRLGKIIPLKSSTRSLILGNTNIKT